MYAHSHSNAHTHCDVYTCTYSHAHTYGYFDATCATSYSHAKSTSHAPTTTGPLAHGRALPLSAPTGFFRNRSVARVMSLSSRTARYDSNQRHRRMARAAKNECSLVSIRGY